MADIIFILHFSFILFVIFGGFFLFTKPRIAFIHVPMVVWAALVNLMSWICPLTPVENLFRSESSYQTGFIEHYIAPIIYPEGIGSNAGIWLGVSVLVWNLLIYGIWFYYKRSKS